MLLQDEETPGLQKDEENLLDWCLSLERKPTPGQIFTCTHDFREYLQEARFLPVEQVANERHALF